MATRQQSRASNVARQSSARTAAWQRTAQHRIVVLDRTTPATLLRARSARLATFCAASRVLAANVALLRARRATDSEMARRSVARMTTHKCSITRLIAYTNVRIVAESHAVAAFCGTRMLTVCTQATTLHCTAQRHSTSIDARHLLQMATIRRTHVDDFSACRYSLGATLDCCQSSTVHLDFVSALERQLRTLGATATRLRTKSLTSMTAIFDQTRTCISTIGDSMINIVWMT
jgi:hypothetical protein